MPSSEALFCDDSYRPLGRRAPIIYPYHHIGSWAAIFPSCPNHPRYLPSHYISSRHPRGSSALCVPAQASTMRSTFLSRLIFASRLSLFDFSLSTIYTRLINRYHCPNPIDEDLPDHLVQNPSVRISTVASSGTAYIFFLPGRPTSSTALDTIIGDISAHSRKDDTAARRCGGRSTVGCGLLSVFSYFR